MILNEFYLILTNSWRKCKWVFLTLVREFIVNIDKTATQLGNMARRNNNIDLGLLILRLVSGLLMLPHGINKIINGHDKIRGMLSEKGLPELLWIGVPVAEVLGPLFIILGIFSRISGLLLVAVMLFSIALTSGLGAFAFGPTGGLKGELNLLFMIIGLVLFITGPGKYVLLTSSREILQ